MFCGWKIENLSNYETYTEKLKAHILTQHIEIEYEKLKQHRTHRKWNCFEQYDKRKKWQQRYCSVGCTTTTQPTM